MKSALEQNGPIIHREMIDIADQIRRGPKDYIVVTIAYDRTGCRFFRHIALKAAYRRLASICSGKLKTRGEFAAAVVTPDNKTLNWRECREILAL